MVQYTYPLGRWRLHLYMINKRRTVIKLEESEDTKSWRSESPEDTRNKPTTEHLQPFPNIHLSLDLCQFSAAMITESLST